MGGGSVDGERGDAALIFKIGKGVFSSAELIELDSSMMELYHLSGSWMCLASVYVHPFVRGRGWGTMVMRLVISYADKHHLGLLLQIRPYSKYGRRFKAAELRRWYETMGFIWKGNNVMIRRSDGKN